MKVKVTFLGTNGWYDTPTGNTICVLLESENEYVVLDAGNGIYKLDQYITRNKPVYLFLSHFHLDHVIGLHLLAKFKFRQGLKIFLQPGQRQLFHRLVNADFTAALDQLPMKVTLTEQPPEFLVKSLELRHPVHCYGVRFDFGGKIIAYIPDTGPCPNANKLADGADLVIAECAYQVGQKVDQWPHLNPATAATIAKKAKAKKLVLVHFDAEVYQDLKARKQAGQQARQIFRQTIAARDGQTLTI